MIPLVFELSLPELSDGKSHQKFRILEAVGPDDFARIKLILNRVIYKTRISDACGSISRCDFSGKYDEKFDF